MVFDVSQVSGIGEFTAQKEPKSARTLYRREGKVFLVLNANTIEMRTDAELGKLLQKRYESVMRSRYFGNGGIEIVLSGQLTDEELRDLVRRSYNLLV